MKIEVTAQASAIKFLIIATSDAQVLLHTTPPRIGGSLSELLGFLDVVCSLLQPFLFAFLAYIPLGQE